MRTSLITKTFGFLGATTLFAACGQPASSTSCVVSANATSAQIKEAADTCFAGEAVTFLNNPQRNDLDLLFVIGNSISMAAKQRAFAEQIPAFIDRIAESRVHAHIGVITTDIGATVGPGQPFAGAGNSACNTFAGDDGGLQRIPCPNRAGVSSEAQLACVGGTTLVNGMTVTVTGLCPDPSFVPSDSRSYIVLNGPEGSSNFKSLMMNGKEVGPARTLQCLSLVGDGGCGVVSPLEAARRALDGHRPENVGFLRADSRVVVIFITDQDDNSVQITRRADNDPNTVTSFTSGGMTYPCTTPLSRSKLNPSGIDIPARCYGTEYRGVARNLECDQPMNSAGAKTNCSARTDSYLDPVTKHVSFFSRLRSNDKLGIGGIWTPSLLDNPSSEVSKDGKLVVQQEPGAPAGTAGLNHGFKTDAACYDPAIPLSTSPNQARGFSGHAQTRLSTFLRSFNPAIRTETSICNRASYQQGSAPLSGQLLSGQHTDCLAVKPNRGSGTAGEGAATCLVGYVDYSDPYELPETTLAECKSSCCSAFAQAQGPGFKDPNVIAACTPEPADCFCAVESPKVCTSTALAAVWQKDNEEPPYDQIVTFRCTGTRPVAP